MKCQKCPKAATLRITEVTGENQFEELHLCEECAARYLDDSQQKSPKGDSHALPESLDTAELNQRQCPECGIKFMEFRSTGRLGCPHDYQAFREQLVPLLENIHGESKHGGKTPRRQPRGRQDRSELAQLRKSLQSAVTRENYEEAARIRDKIRQLEQT